MAQLHSRLAAAFDWCRPQDLLAHRVCVERRLHGLHAAMATFGGRCDDTHVG